MTENKYKISLIEDLKSLASINRSQRYVTLNLAFLSGRQNRHYNEKINKQLNACGCETGKYFAFWAILFCFAGIWTKISLFQTSTLMIVLVSILIVLFAAILGKIVGLLSARQKLKFLVREIKNIARQQEIKEEQAGVIE